MVTSTFAAPTAGTLPGSNTRTLLGALALSGPLWAVVSLAQAATREGFDLTRHPLSMLSVGSLGWLQITNFIVAGVLAILGAVGLKQAIPSRWAPRLVITYGIGYILSGVFVMQPGDGFPAGTPVGQSGPLAWHTVAHLIVGIIAFIALTAGLFVLGRYFARRGERGWAWGARVAASGVIVANVAASAQVLAPSVVLAVGVVTAMLFLSLIAMKLRRERSRVGAQASGGVVARSVQRGGAAPGRWAGGRAAGALGDVPAGSAGGARGAGGGGRPDGIASR